MLSLKKIGRYEVTSVMGQGAMGTVYKAVDPLIERIVAIKTINLELSKEERAEFEERFYREAKSAGRLSHPNIVTIYDVGETDEAAYIAMEFLEGQSLREMLDSGVVLPLKRICSIAAKVATALNYAHENGVVHRDIKPANIMILRNRDVKIMDFGIALIPTGSRTQAGTALGSPKYMAPEQLAGKATDGRADIFSLGVMLYEMLTGSTPFNGDNLSAIMYKILNEEPVLPGTLNARVPAEFDRIVARALAKRPEDRYQTAKEFARDLRHYYEVLVSQEESQGGAASKPVRKNIAGLAQRNDAADLDPLDVKTEILIPPASHRNASDAKPAPSAAKSRRKVFLLAIPLLALAAFALLNLARRPQAPAVPGPQAQTSADEPAMNKSEADKPVEDMPPPATQPSRPAAPPTHTAATPAKPAAEKSAAAPAASASLSFAITPWGAIFIDGEMAGISPPLTSLKLEPGLHNIEIRNGTFTTHHVKVKLEPGQSLKIRHKFK